MQNSHAPACVGDRVRVRRRRWTVVDAQPYERCGVLTLSALDPPLVGQRQRVLWPFEHVVAVTTAERPRVVSAGAWRATCRELLAADGMPSSLRAALGARMSVLPHQLEPALAVLAGRTSRVLIADEVGLGKTVQAALIMAELIARGAVDRCLVLTPAQLRDQWIEELAARFDLAAASVDARFLARRVSELPVGMNPWLTLPIAVASIDYVKRAEVLPACAAARWDLVVVDEAHATVGASDRTSAVQTLATRAAYVVLLTATPHSGDRRRFVSLCELGSLRADDLAVFRRTRVDVSLGLKRRVHKLMVASTPAERRVQQLLDELTRALDRECTSADANAWLSLGVLAKRAQSSAWSLGRSIIRRLEHTRERGTDEGQPEEQLRLPLDDPSGELTSADEAPLVIDPILRDQHTERRLLRQLLDAAQTASEHETKLARLRRLLRALGRRTESAIVFTEYRDTLLHVSRHLGIDNVILHGGLTREARRAALDAFLGGRATVLLATDAAGEGLNLQRSCRVIVNLELPWNPMRLEQRIGRIDRIGQTRTVHAFHVISGESRETDMLARLAERIGKAQADIGAADPLGLSTVPRQGVTEASVAPVRLREEAVAEYERIARCRRLSLCHRGTSTPRSEGQTIIAFAKRRRFHALLDREAALIMVQAALVDEAGRLTASVVVPFATALPAPGDSVDFLRRVRAIAPRIIEPAIERWTSASFRQQREFWSVRLNRERAIAERLNTSHDLLQPGLFDQRAAHEDTRHSDERLDLLKSIAQSIAVAESALHSVRVVVRSIAALAPRR